MPNQSDKDKIDFNNYTDITLEDIRMWKTEIEKVGIKKNRFRNAPQKISMDNDRVYFNGPLYGSCPRSTYEKLIQGAINEMIDKNS